MRRAERTEAPRAGLRQIRVPCVLRESGARRARPIWALAALCAVSGAAASASTTLTFDGLQTTLSPGSTYSQSGFRLEVISGSRFGNDGLGNPGDALWVGLFGAPTIGDTVSISRIDGSEFTFDGYDLLGRSFTGSDVVDIVGRLGGADVETEAGITATGRVWSQQASGLSASFDELRIVVSGTGNDSLLLDNLVFVVLPSGPGPAEEIADLAAAAAAMAPLVAGRAARHVAFRARDGLAARDARLSFTRLRDPGTGETIVTQSTRDVPGLAGDVYAWAEITGFRAEDDGADRSYSGRGLQVGADMALSNDMVAGLSFGIQDLSSSVGTVSQDGVLRFVQPYLAYRAGAWSGEATLLYGFGDYDQNSAGGDGTGDTRLAALTFSGGYDMPLGDAVTLTPGIGLVHGVERIEGRTGTLAGTGTETVRFTEISLGAEMSRAIGGGEVFAGLHADWLDTGSDTQLVSDLLVDGGWTGRVEFGLSSEIGRGLLLDTSVELSGLGGDLRTTEGALTFALRF